MSQKAQSVRKKRLTKILSFLPHSNKATSISNLFKAQRPKTQAFMILVIAVVTVASTQLVIKPLYRLLRASDGELPVEIPQNMTALEYLNQMKQADLNGDGVINGFDYASMLDEYGQTQAFVTSDVNRDGIVNGVDSSVMLYSMFLDVDETTKAIEESEQYKSEISENLNKNIQTELPETGLTEISAETFAEESGGGNESFGRNVIPSVLGTVSPYTGAGSYGFNIDVPQGPSGLSPSISIAYSTDSIDDARYNKEYGDVAFHRPSYAGHGFNVTGVGSIMRDTRSLKDLFEVNGPNGREIYHRYILNIPGGPSAELEFNRETGTWVSIPQGFLKIEQRNPGFSVVNGVKYLDPHEWVITTKNGIKYYFGEENIGDRLEDTGRIKNSIDMLDGSKKIGTRGGNSYVELDTINMCDGRSMSNPCEGRRKDGKGLMVTKWLLRKVVQPDGQHLDYTYEVQQKDLGSRFTENVQYITAASYPQLVVWNDGKHRVRFVNEERPDKGYDRLTFNRLDKVVVESQVPGETGFKTNHIYDLTYENIGDWGISVLSSIQEFGTDGTTALPAAKFDYDQLTFSRPGEFGQTTSGESYYLSSIDNGLGGVTSFKYDPFEVVPCTSEGRCRDKNARRRARVIEKQVTDNTIDKKSYKETYSYEGEKAYYDIYLDIPGGGEVTGFEFLGHSLVDVKGYDFDNLGGALLSHSRTSFYQSNDVFEGDTLKCREPHLAKGQAFKQSVFNLDDVEVQTSETTYKYRKNGRNDLDPSEGCDPARGKQPYFMYSDATKSTTKDPLAQSLLPGLFSDKLKVKPFAEITTLSKNLEYDDFGNLTKAVSYGEINKDGTDVDVSDTVYSYSKFLTNGSSSYWMKGLPYLSYSSLSGNCAENDNSCQWGKSITYYDNFDKDYREINPAIQDPSLGLVTQTRSQLTNDVEVVGGVEYLSFKGVDGETHYGGPIKSYGPKPNIKTVEGPKDIMLQGETKYDDFYHTLVVEQKNALGYTIKYSNFDYLIGVPTRIESQIDTNPARFSAAEMVFDPLGRMIASFGPDPEAPGKVLSQPTSIQHFFDRGNDGLVSRQMALVSQTKDGAYHYVTSDTFYDGLGNPIQVQSLEKKIGDGLLRIVQSKGKIHADGAVSEQYQSQTASAVSLQTPDANNYSSVITSVEPQYIPMQKIVTGRTEYDAMRRPIKTTAIDPERNESIVTQTGYSLNGSKSVTPKGVQSIQISDSAGRTIHSMTVDSSGSKGLLTTNVYDLNSLVQKPIKTIIEDSSGEKVESSARYDRAGRILETTDPSLGTYKYSYDVQGNVILTQSQPREDISAEYDVLGRLVKTTFEGANNNELYRKDERSVIEYTYDKGPFALGKLANVKHPTGEESYVYDGGQRLVESKIRTFDREKTFKTSFDKLSQIKESLYPDGTKLTYEYDNFGSAQKMYVDGKEVRSGVTFDRFGNTIRSDVQNNGVRYTDQSVFDQLGRVRSITVNEQSPAGTGYETRLNQNISYNQFGEINGLNETILGKKNAAAYTYDTFSQLIAVTSNVYNGAYSYDLFGRIQTKNEGGNAVALTYNAQFPFFAPKSASVAGLTDQKEPEDNLPTPNPTDGDVIRDPQNDPNSDLSPAQPSPVPLKRISNIPLPSQNVEPTLLPTLEVVETPVASPTSQFKKKGPILIPGDPISETFNVGTLSDSKETFDITYNVKGHMNTDEFNCYYYNRNGKMIEMRVRKSPNASCTDMNAMSTVLYFYYNHEGSMNMQEEYNPSNLKKPIKTTYLFGNYEEISRN